MEFYNRFNNNKTVEPFSNDYVFNAFSKMDTDYVTATGSIPCTSCSDTTITTDDECKQCYKYKVDKLTNLKDTKDASQKNLDDNSEIYSSITMDNINLAIGISIMLGTIYYMNQ